MTIRINGKTEIENATARLGGDGGLLTLVLRRVEMTMGEISSMLCDAPKIEMIRDGFVTSVYMGMKLRTLQMETVGGVVTVTASLQVDRIAGDTADRLEQEIMRQTQTISKQSQMIETLGKTAQEQNETIAAQSEVIAEQERTIRQMEETVRKAQEAAQGAADAISAIEEGVMSV